MNDPVLFARLSDPERLRALEATDLLDSPADEAFDRLTRLAARLLGVPTSLVTLVGDRRQFFKSVFGVGEPWVTQREAPPKHSFCQTVVAQNSPFQVEDARLDARVQDDLAMPGLGIVAYLGVPIIDSDQRPLGALCAIDQKPRQWTRQESLLLTELAAEVSHEIVVQQAVRALRQSERTQRVALENLPNTAVALFGRDLHLLTAHGTALLSSLGFTAEALEGARVQDILSLGNPAALLPLYGLALEGKASRLILNQQGRHLDVQIGPVRDEKGRNVGGLVTLFDLTERYQAELAVREKTTLLESVLASMDELVTVFDATGNVVLSNAPLRPLAEPREASAPARDGTVFLPDQRTLCPVAVLPHLQALRGVRVQQLELFVREAPGSLAGHWESVNAAPLLDGHGQVTGAVTVSRDVTASREASQQLFEQSRQVMLLERVAVAANMSPGIDESLREVLGAICAETGWPLAHVYLPHVGVMAPSELWVADDLDRFQDFVAASMQLEFPAGRGLIGQAAEAGRLCWVEKLAEEPAFLRRPAALACGLTSALFLPVLTGTEVVAVIEFFLGAGAEVPNQSFIEVLENVGSILGRVFEREKSKRDLEAYAEEVRALSLVDELTGLYNRRGFLTLAEQQVRIGQRTKMRHHLFFADLDGMKHINDQHGHAQGDEALRDTASLLRKVFRDSDLVARLGGDEFVAFAADTVREGDGPIAERFQVELAAHNAARRRPYVLQVSLGFTIYDPASPRSLEELLAEADTLMYAEKRTRGSQR